MSLAYLPPVVRALVSKGPTVARVPHRSVISLGGSQASEFLNGVLSTSVPEPARGPFFSAFLNAQARYKGRVLYDVFVYTRQTPEGRPEYLLEYDNRPSEAPPLLGLLKRYILRSKVKARDASQEYDVWAAWGSDSESRWESLRAWSFARSGAVEPAWNASSEWPWGTGEEIIRDRRAVGMGHRLLVRKGDQPKQASTHEVSSSEAYTTHRILHGVPEGLTDIPSTHAFPMDSNLDVMGGLDFRKGCYVGQELTVRTYHTGVVRKRILPVVIHKPSDSLQDDGLTSLYDKSFPTGPDIRAVTQSTPDRPVPRPRGTGKLLSSSQGIALALLRMEHVEGVQRGDLKIEFEDAGSTWAVSHWWPDWWPKPVSSQPI